MDLKVNGEHISIDGPAKITDLLAKLDLLKDKVAIEKNGQFLDPAESMDEPLADGDVIEIVRFVGGG